MLPTLTCILQKLSRDNTDVKKPLHPHDSDSEETSPINEPVNEEICQYDKIQFLGAVSLLNVLGLTKQKNI